MFKLLCKEFQAPQSRGIESKEGREGREGGKPAIKLRIEMSRKELDQKLLIGYW